MKSHHGVFLLFLCRTNSSYENVYCVMRVVVCSTVMFVSVCLQWSKWNLRAAGTVQCHWRSQEFVFRAEIRGQRPTPGAGEGSWEGQYALPHQLAV